MNRCCEENQFIYSNNRIFEGCFTEAAKREGALGQAVIGGLKTVKKAVCSARAKRIAKAVFFTVCLVGFVGIIGAMEAGSLALGTGLILGSALLAIEYLCLRNH